MKPLTTALLFSFALAGAACSEGVTNAAEAAPVEAEPAETVAETSASESGISGSLNLNLGETREPSSGRVLGASGLGQGGSAAGGSLLGSSGLGSANFGDVPDIGISIETDNGPGGIDLSTAPAPATDEDDDGLVRLP